MKPSRECAICGHKIREKERLCADCVDDWRGEIGLNKENEIIPELTSEWINGIINYAEYEFNVQLRDYGRVSSMELKRNL